MESIQEGRHAAREARHTAPKPIRKAGSNGKRSHACGISAGPSTLGRGAFALVFLALLVPFAARATYQEIAVPTPSRTEAKNLFFHPDLEVMGDDDGRLMLLSRPEITEELRARGFEVEVVIPDLEAYYREQAGYTRDYGVWHTYAEMLQEMNLIHTQFPNLTTTPASIGTTGEGRAIWAMKVSDHPNVQENEPEVYIDGVHHAREIMALEVPLYLIRYFCENYGVDPTITFLVDNRQIWFVPMVNPDGFVYNETTDPNGGGLWRKNRRNNGGGCFGVDNNRNYPYEWVGQGSSTNPCDDTFRGPSAGSEPETQAVMTFVNNHHFIVSQSYHSVAAMVLFPWGYTTNDAPDAALFQSVATEMARDGGYATGQPPELLYPVNGVSIDWHYGEGTGHPRIYAFTTEVGGSGFWPAPSERDGLIAENVHMNIYLCEIAGAYLDLLSTQVSGGDGNGRLDPGESVSLVITVRNPGVLFGATNVSATLFCQDPYVQLTDGQISLGTIAPGATVTSTLDPFDLTVDPSCPAGRPVSFTIRLQADGGLQIDESTSFTVGQLPVLYADDFEQAAGAWTQDPSHTAVTGAFLRADPVGTPHQPEDDTTPAPGVNCWFTAQNPGGADGTDDVDDGVSATRSPAINLSGVAHAELNLNYFHGQRDTGDDANDYFRIDLSNDGGASFPVNLVQIGDVITTAAWRNLRVNLDEYMPLTANMMIRVQASDGSGASGMADIIEAGLDDVYIFNRGSGNESPTAPTLVSPPDQAQNQIPAVALTVANGTDPEGDPLTYGFRVYTDALLTQLVRSIDGIPEGPGGTTSWNVNPPLNPGTTYYWRAFAADPTSRSLFMAPASFTVAQDPTAVAENSVHNGISLSAGPNPSSRDVRIRYYTPAVPTATLEIFDTVGRKVRSLAGVRRAEGWQEVRWDGRADNGAEAPAGVYWVRLLLPGETRSVRVVRVQ